MLCATHYRGEVLGINREDAVSKVKVVGNKVVDKNGEVVLEAPSRSAARKVAMAYNGGKFVAPENVLRKEDDG